MMMDSYLIYKVLLCLLIITAILAIEYKNLLYAVIISGVSSSILAILYYFLKAPDVALTEAAVGTGLTTVIFIMALAKTSQLEFFEYNSKGEGKD